MFSDFILPPWTDVNSGHPRTKKRRTATYTVELSSTFGPKATNVTEKQVITVKGIIVLFLQ